MSHEKQFNEARTKLIWGESQEEVLQYLQSEGVGDKQARGIIKLIQAERNAEIRAFGRSKIFTGLLMTMAPVAFWFFSIYIGIIYTKIFGITIAIGLFGVWRIVSGTLMLFMPQMEKGSLSKLSD